jgi:RNA polymerase sigma factor (sigma-70 family)
MFEEMRNLNWKSGRSFADYLFQQKANQFLEWYSTSSEGIVKRSAEAEAEELNQICQNLILISLLCRETVERSEENFGNPLVEKKTNHWLSTALSQLSQNESMLINGYYFENLTPKELSVRLHISVSQIQRAHLKALALLKKFLDSDPEPKTHERSR